MIDEIVFFEEIVKKECFVPFLDMEFKLHRTDIHDQLLALVSFSLTFHKIQVADYREKPIKTDLIPAHHHFTDLKTVHYVDPRSTGRALILLGYYLKIK